MTGVETIKPDCPDDTPGAAGRRRKFRVLHVIDSLDLGGAQVVLENLIRHGNREQFEFEAAAMHGRGVYWDRLAALGVPLHSLSFHHKVPLYVPRLVWLCLTRRYDVIHTHLLAANVIAKPVATFCGVRVRINHDHCNDKLTDPRRWALPADRLTNRLSTHVIAVSDSTRSFLVEKEGVPADRTTTVHNGIDLEKFRPRPEQRAAAREKWNLPANAFVVAGIGRLTFQKNFALFLDVAAAVVREHPHAVFVLVGTGEDEPALRAQAERLGLGERVRFLGYVADMPALWPAFDCLLLTSRYEGLPITILEAMACGTPIVASNLDGMREILRDGENADLVPPGEPAPYTARVRRLITEAAVGTTHAHAALATVRAGYSAEAMARAVESIYLRYLEPKGAAR
jgi:glycosyltransferase involved in cell wall biosynthesis